MNTTRTHLTIGAKLFLGSILGLMLFGGIAMTTKAFRELNESRQARAWPTAPGKVTRSTMSESTGGLRSNQRDSAPGNYYEARIEYEFQVAGVTYHGNRSMAVQDMNANKSHVESVLSKYPVDQAVTVSYKPDDPSQSVLEPGGWGGFAIQLPLSLVFTGIPIVLLWLLWRARSPG
jgi:hypothetical protein